MARRLNLVNFQGILAYLCRRDLYALKDFVYFLIPQFIGNFLHASNGLRLLARCLRAVTPHSFFRSLRFIQVGVRIKLLCRTLSV